MEYVEVRDGGRVPALGLGTWQLRGSRCREVVAEALELGYRHVDTAQLYRNESEVGRGIADSGIDPAEVFVTTKLTDANRDRDRVRSSVLESRDALGLDTIDMLLIHRPGPMGELGETLTAMRQLQDDGVVAHLGVSNFSSEQLDLAVSQAPVVCNQVEHHPYNQHPELVRQAAERGITLTAYSPLAHGQAVGDAAIAEVARRRGCTPAQVILRWLLDQPNVSTIPKASTRAHLQENFEALDLRLDDDDRERMASLDRNEPALQ